MFQNMERNQSSVIALSGYFNTLFFFFFFKGMIAWRISSWDEIKAIANIIIIVIIIIIIVSYETTSLRKLNLPFQLGLKFHFDSMDC